MPALPIESKRRPAVKKTPGSGSAALFVRPISLRHQIASALVRDILTGVYKPGQRLVERTLVKRFGVSAIPIREALQDLENQGLLIKRVNAGCSVIALSREEAIQICLFRKALEPQVISWAASRITAEFEASLRAKLAAMRAAADSDDLPAFFLADLEFHETLWAAADNRWAARALFTAVGSLFATGLMASQRSGIVDVRAEVMKHEKMLACLLAKDGASAAACLVDIAGSFEQRVLPAIGAPEKK